MGYIEKNLMEGEKVVMQAKLHWVQYTWPGVMLLLALLLLVLPFSHDYYVHQALFAGVLAAIALIWIAIVHGGRKYILTTRRIIAKEGIVRRESLELLLRKCEGVKIEQSIMGRILNYGRVIVTTGEATDSFEFIAQPIRFSTQINQQIDKLRDDS